ncbi:MAG: translation initiation factor IF-2 [Propionibacteriaceae bacterium]|nr:translation initiation factor IF-2 [Propionibacteriaceae bacterium]
MAKTRVHELAKELGLDSKTVLATLKEMGEYVRSASSTVEAPVERRLREKFASVAPPAPPVVETPPPPLSQEAPMPPAAPTESESPQPEVSEPVADSEPEIVDPPVTDKPDEADGKPSIPKPSSMIPRPMPRPAPGQARRPGAPRPGNNPYAPSQGMGVRRPPREESSRGPGEGSRQRPGAGGPPGFSRSGSTGAPTRGAGPGSSAPTGAGRPARGRGSSPFGGPTQGPGMPMGRGGRGGRTGSGTQGAFGRQGAPARKNKKSKKLRRQEFDEMEAPTISGVRIRPGDGETVRLPRGSSLTDFAEKIGVDPAQLVQLLFNMGEMLTATQSVSDDTLEILGSELNYDIQVVSPEDEDRELLQTFDLGFGENLADEADLVVRSPIVTIMGHVDHGKTKLLDAFRRTNIVEGEAGGITQAIGAYQVATKVDGEDRSVTFIDTPGHEAFTAMRVRGAQVTDIAVLVVAADDGVMPQTVEALNHATAADVPVVVAVNKIDKEGADPSKVRGQLSEYGLVPDTYGGDTMFIDVSAVTGDGLDELLTAIVLTADASLDLRVDPHMPAQGVAIEAHLDRGRGPVATTIVQRGTLNIGDSIVVGNSYGRVRALINDHGAMVEEADPSTPVQILGLTAVPGAGDNVLVVDDERTARQIAEKREARMRAAALAKATKRRTLEDLFKEMEKGEELNLILKGDSAGSVEALEDALLNIDVGDEVTLRIIDRGVGAITETNVALAAASNAIIIGFHVRAQGHATQVANQEGVDIRYYSIIYQAIDDVESALKGMLKPIFEEQARGTAEIRETFKYSKAGMIAGCMILSGTIRRHAQARVVRDGIVVAETSINTLRREKDDVVEVREGYECGMTLTGFSDIRIGDQIETYEMVEKPRD